MSSPLDLIAAQAPVTDANLLAAIDRGEVVAAPLAVTTPATVPSLVSEDFFAADPLSSSNFNRYFLSVQQDLVRLFAAANDSDRRISALEAAGEDDLTKLAAQLDRLESQLQAMRDLQLGYAAGYTVYSRVDLIDDAAVERNPGIVGSYTPAAYDPQLQALTLPVQIERDTLHADAGTTIVTPTIDLQYGRPLGAYSHLRTPAHAVDASGNSYWAEVVLSDEPVNLPWPGIQSRYGNAVTLGALQPLAGGTVCEFTLTYRQPTAWNQLLIKPFCELPINLAAVFCVKRDGATVPGALRIGDAEQNGYGRYLLAEYNSARSNGALFLNQTQRLFFPLQEETLSLTLVLHQPHYTREVFTLAASHAAQSSLWQQMLGNTPLLGVPQTLLAVDQTPQLDLNFTQPQDLVTTLANAIGADLNGSFTAPRDAVHTYTKYQYVYGAYDIGVKERRYGTHGTFVSTPLTSSLNLMQGTLIADADLPLMATTVNTTTGDLDGSVNLSGFQVPAATLVFDLTFGEGQVWAPFVPLDQTLTHELYTVTAQTSSVPLRLQPRVGTPVYITSFDGQGGAIVEYARSFALNSHWTPSAAGGTLSSASLLFAPGNYMISYTPLDTGHWVNFGVLAEAAGAQVQKHVTFSGAVSQLTGLQLPSEPYIDPNRINGSFEPNGDAQTEYVPLTVAIDGLSLSFPEQVTSAGRATVRSSFSQNIAHAADLYLTTEVVQEVLYSNEGNPTAAVVFTAAHPNWDRRPEHAPQLFAIAPNTAPLEILPVQNGQQVWTVDYGSGTIRFLNGNAAASGQVAVTYWYQTPTFAPTTIVNRTNFLDDSASALTPFDPVSYPVIEYVLVDDKLYFNLDLPAAATISIHYTRLFDTVRVRARFDRADPSNPCASAHLYGYTFLARDANGTSLPTGEVPAVVWGDLELESLGTTTQNNPGIGLISGNAQSATGLPALTQFNWYRIVNAGSATDTLRASYDASNGTTVFWDFNGDRYIEPDGGISRELTYRILNVDGSNTLVLAPGESAVVGLANFLVPPNTPGALNRATIYSGQNGDYLQTSDWLLTAAQVTQETSIASVVIS